MLKSFVKFNNTPLVGIKVKTSYDLETVDETSRVSLLWNRYINEEIAFGIPDRRNPGITFCAYLEYEDNDHMGEYSYFIGEEVVSVNAVPDNLEVVRIPEGNFVKFTDSGTLPNIVKDIWRKIWNMKSSDLGGKRSYNLDFEIIDMCDENLTVRNVGIYVGIKL